jgi:thiol-disulfide isomerase/thioredoxin
MSAESHATNLLTPGRIVATLAVALLVATMGYMLISGHRVEESDLKIALPGTQASSNAKAPPDFEIKTLDGRAIKLSDYRGKVVVLDFWATWCPPCREGTPQLVRIANEKRSSGVEVIGLHIDDRGRSSPDAIRRFAQQFGVTYTIGLATDDMFTSYLGTVEDSIPQSLVFDRSGRAIAHFVGYSRASAQELDEAVNRALAGS